jgi:replicative DNA helicase
MLRETGAFEDAAQVIILLYLPRNEETNKPTSDDELIIGKMREGAVSTVLTTFNGPRRTFGERQF